jgi:hypothetical protein
MSGGAADKNSCASYCAVGGSDCGDAHHCTDSQPCAGETWFDSKTAQPIFMKKLLHLLTLVATLVVMNPRNLNAQETNLNLQIYDWYPSGIPIHNVLVSWSGGCGSYDVLTNANLNSTNWGVYSTVERLYWLNNNLMSVFTISGVGGSNEVGQMFFKVEANLDPDQSECPPQQNLIITHPYDTPAYTNWPVSLITYTIGSEDRVHQWHKDGVAIPGETNMVFTIANAQPSDEGEYHLTVSNALHVLTSQIAYITVLEEEFVPPPTSPSPPPGGMGMSSQESMAMDAMGVLEWYYDPFAVINPIIQQKLKKIELEIEK